MLHEKMKAVRIQRGLSQEELAIQLNVVRQTVSKWENGLSVPDADLLIKIAEILKVPVSELLDIEKTQEIDLAKELQRVNLLLAEKIEQERLNRQANHIRGKMLTIILLGIVVSSILQHSILSGIILIISAVSALVILYRNIHVLTAVTTQHFDSKPIQLITLVNIFTLLVFAGAALLAEIGVLQISHDHGALFIGSMIAILILFTGHMSIKLPFNRHTGLRLPWTVSDEDTWIYAHRLLNITSIPVALLYLAGILVHIDFETLTLIIICAWIGIPGILSLLFYRKKYTGK